MRIIGLTGGIGAGKSAVAARMAGRGAVVIDVDAIGREVLEPGGAAAAEVIERFGERVVDDDGRIDRARLAKVVFSDREALAALEDISHPAINVEIDRRLDAIGDDALVVLDMAILVGSRLGRDLPSGPRVRHRRRGRRAGGDPPRPARRRSAACARRTPAPASRRNRATRIVMRSPTTSSSTTATSTRWTTPSTR